MNKKFISTILILGAVVAAGYFFWANKPMVVVNIPLEKLETSTIGSSTTSSLKSRKVTTEKSSTASKNIYVVTYTEDGFEPRELQIPRGASVKFVNKTNTSMRIFADKDAKPPFSDLNQPKALGQNGEYVFNFVYSGIWEYNNSLHPEDAANVVVY
jgi:plastocyanin